MSFYRVRPSLKTGSAIRFRSACGGPSPGAQTALDDSLEAICGAIFGAACRTPFVARYRDQPRSSGGTALSSRRDPDRSVVAGAGQRGAAVYSLRGVVPQTLWGVRPARAPRVPGTQYISLLQGSEDTIHIFVRFDDVTPIFLAHKAGGRLHRFKGKRGRNPFGFPKGEKGTLGSRDALGFRGHNTYLCAFRRHNANFSSHTKQGVQSPLKS